ncbi:uncharacterized protein LOC123203834 [Mangifera indica]|uniref:uncharacterized protein LOC123203834 n=1 Tax=Mangifera indica TaxID=29780 RepID=UPI001CFB8564|nr:uncharacterized protein LOC123203834 [Mangifera indica]
MGMYGQGSYNSQSGQGPNWPVPPPYQQQQLLRPPLDFQQGNAAAPPSVIQPSCDRDTDDLHYNGKQKKQGRSRSRSPVDQWRRTSPWTRREKQSQYWSWSLQNQRRSRSPRNWRSRSRSPRNWRSRSRSPRNWTSRGWSPKNRRSRSRSPGRQRIWSRSFHYRHVGRFSNDSMRRERGQIPDCIDFSRGRCYRGASCRYLHHDSDRGEGSKYWRSKQLYLEVPRIPNNSNIHEDYKHNLSKASDKERNEVKITEMKRCENVPGNSSGQLIDFHAIKSGSSREAAAEVSETQILEGQKEGPTALINKIWRESVESQNSKLVVGFPHASQNELPLEQSVVKQSQSNLSYPVENASSKDGSSVESSSGLREKTSDDISDHDTSCKYPKQQNAKLETNTKEISPPSHLDVMKDDCSVNETYKEENCQDLSYCVPITACIGHSKKKLLVLDVNGILAAISQLPVREGWKPHYIVSRKAVFKRPHCHSFLQFCFERFNVGIWTSRIKKNVERAVQFLLGDFKHHLLFCWDASHCSETGLTAIGDQDKPLVLKELKKLWVKAECGLPWREGEYNETNTLLVDDSPYKALRNPAYTAIFPYSYQYWDTEDKSLGPGGDLREYLEQLSHAENVQEFVRQNPFGQPPINESNPHWSYYSQVFCTNSSQSDNVGDTSLVNTNVDHKTPQQTLSQIVSDPQ